MSASLPPTPTPTEAAEETAHATALETPEVIVAAPTASVEGTPAEATAESRGAVVAGRVVFAEGIGAAGVEVEIVEAPARTNALRATTDEDGGFRFEGLSAVRYALSVLPSLGDEAGIGRNLTVPPPRIIDLRNGEEMTDIVLLVSYGRVIEGVVSSTSGVALPGATVEVGGTMPSGERFKVDTTTDARGGFLLSGVPAELEKAYGRAKLAGFDPEWKSVPSGGTRCDIVLAPLGHIIVHVVDEDTGLPPTRYNLTLTTGTGDSLTARSTAHDATETAVKVGGIGREPFEMVAEGLDIAGRTTGRRATLRRQLETVPHGEEFTLTLGLPDKLVVRVLTADRGRPVPDAKLILAGEASRHALPTTDETGMYVFESVNPGDYFLHADPGPGLTVIPMRVEVARHNGTTSVTLNAYRTTPIRGRIVSSGAKNLGRYRICAEVIGLRSGNSDWKPWEACVESAADGTWEFAGVPHGALTLTVIPPKPQSSISRELDHPRDTADEIVFETGAGGRVEARLTVQGTEPEMDASLILQPTGRAVEIVELRGEGGRISGTVAPGSYRASFAWNGMRTEVQGPILVRASDVLRLQEEIPAGRVTFQIELHPAAGKLGSLMFMGVGESASQAPIARRLATADDLTMRQFPAGTWRAELYPWRGSSGGPLATANFTVTPGCDIEVPLVPLER